MPQTPRPMLPSLKPTGATCREISQRYDSGAAQEKGKRLNHKRHVVMHHSLNRKKKEKSKSAFVHNRSRTPGVFVIRAVDVSSIRSLWGDSLRQNPWLTKDRWRCDCFLLHIELCVVVSRDGFLVLPNRSSCLLFPYRPHRITPHSANLPPPPSPSSLAPGRFPNTFQNRSVSSPAPVTTVLPSGLIARYSTR